MSTPWLDQLKLRALDPDRSADVVIASIPLPKDNHAIATFQGIPSQVVPIAWYPGKDGAPGLPRQVLALGIPGAQAAHLPAELGVTTATNATIVNPNAPIAAPTSNPSWAGPSWRFTTLEEKKTGFKMFEKNELILEHAGRQLGIRMGIELTGSGDEGWKQSKGFHWWNWLRVEQLWTGPVCTAIRAAGYVGITEVGEDELFDPARYNSGVWLHRHNWLFGEVYAQVFINGLVRVTARHVNNRFFDQGRDLEGFVPVIGFRAPGTAGANITDTPLDGSRTDLALGKVQLDIDRSTDLISPEHPGRIRTPAPGSADSLVIYQPYEGTEFLLGDGQPADRWKVVAKERRMWKGMARSVGFDLSFADKPLRTRRYTTPYGYQAYVGALWPDGALAARGPLEATCDKMLETSGDSPPERVSPSLGCKPRCSGRYFQVSSMWDGEFAHGMMRQAQRTGRRDLYDAAIHHAYAFADVGIDHADFTQQIVGMPKGSISLVLQRGIGMLAAYLETGDPYLLRVTESLADTAYAIDRSNWPRRSFGRDAAYIRTLTRLYDVTGQSFYLHRAGEACRRVTQCQRPDGSYNDQGGASEAHGHLNEVVKPWMNSILSEVLADYMERAGTDAVVEASLVRTGNWLLSVILEDKDGKYWPYQHAWGDNVTDPTVKWSKDKTERKHPVGDVQLDYNARTLLWISRCTGDPRYGRTWQETYQRHFVRQGKLSSSYGAVKVPDNFPWHEAHLWNARWDGQRVSFQPVLDLIEVGREATIELPNGKAVRVRRTATGVEII